MIASFADDATEALFNSGPGRATRHLPQNILSVAMRKLDMLNVASQLIDLTSPPGNRLEPLTGDLTGFHSIRIDEQWRIVFRWDSPDAHDVRIVDDH